MALLPQNETFFDLLDQLCDHMVTAAEQLVALVATPPGTEPAGVIATRARTADELTLSELKRLDAAFITPLDREDLMELMSGLNGVVEAIADTAARYVAYRLAAPFPAFGEPVGALLSVTQSLRDLVAPLRKGHTLAELDAKLRQVRECKRTADDQVRAVTASVLNAREEVTPETLKRLDLLTGFGDALDRSDAVRVTLQEVILKNS